MVIYVVLVSFIINDFMDIQVRTFASRIEYLQVFKHELRGAKVNEEEKKRLNKSAGKILREAGLNLKKCRGYDWIKKETEYEGYAEYYLVSFNDWRNINEPDATVYQRLVDIDTRLGTELSLQLWCCLSYTTRWDIIKVFSFSSNARLKFYLDCRL